MHWLVYLSLDAAELRLAPDLATVVATAGQHERKYLACRAICQD